MTVRTPLYYNGSQMQEMTTALIDELKGEKSGASKGKGGSQVICDHNFLSNAILGSTVA